MRWQSLRYNLHILHRGVTLHCPACGHGHLYVHGLRLRETCPYCNVRFERASGESLGAMYLTSAATLLLMLGGFWVLDVILDADPRLFLTVWIGIVIALNLVFYRAARALWIAIAYLTGGVYPDPDYEREYIAPQKQRTHHARRQPPA